MLHKAWNSKGEILYCFSRSSIKFQGHTVQNITDFDPNWPFPDYRPVAAFKSLRFALFMVIRQISRSHGSKNCQIWPKLGVSGQQLQFEFTDGYEMLHKAWDSKGEVPYCFPRSSIKFQGHTGQNITDFDPNWAFPDYRPVAAFKSLRFALFHCNSRNHRARHFPLPNGPGQVKLPVGQVDLDRFFFFILYKQIEEFQNSWSRASDDFEKRRALNHHKQLIIGHRKISDVAAVLSIGIQ